MRYLPIAVDLESRVCVVVGGGDVAARKVETLLQTGAKVTVIAPEVSDEITAWAEREPRLTVARRAYRNGDLAGAAIAFAATGSVAVHSAVAEEAASRGVWLNAADDPEHCTFLMPAIVERGPLAVAVGTGGASPALARRVRDEIAARIGMEYGEVAEYLGSLRRRFRAGVARQRAFARLLDEGLVEAFRNGDRERIERLTDRACRDLDPTRGGRADGGDLLKASLLSYLVGTLAGAAHLVRPGNAARSTATIALALGFVLQAAAIVVRVLEFGSFAVASFGEQIAFFTCLLAGGYLLAQMRYHLAVLGAVVGPIGFIGVLAMLVAHGEMRDVPPDLRSPWLRSTSPWPFSATPRSAWPAS
jgi:siroheme synthase-like protein